MCTFIANDLDDIEKDRINHPERPLPSGGIKASLAVMLYFFCLMLALFTTRRYVEAGTAFWYYAFFILTISYGYVVDYFPGLKSFYVAVAISAPTMIVANYYSAERLYLAAGSIFLLVLGRELCMDFVDRAGDIVSFMHKIEPRPLAFIAFSLQVIGLILLAIQADRLLDIVDLCLMATLLSVSCYCWLKLASYRRAISLMKFQLFLGLYFLV
jgi:geranylgeranylglycerol-phosphate geranylgeranyltransferase